MFIRKIIPVTYKLLTNLTFENKLSNKKNIIFNKFINEFDNKIFSSARIKVYEQKQIKPNNLYICNIDIANTMNNNLLNEKIYLESEQHSKLSVIKYLFLDNLLKQSNIYDKFIINLYDGNIKEITSFTGGFNFDISSLDFNHNKSLISYNRNKNISNIIREFNTRQIKKITLCDNFNSKYKINIITMTDDYSRTFDNINYLEFDNNFPEIDNFIFDRKLFFDSLYKKIYSNYKHSPERVNYLMNYYSNSKNISHVISYYNYGYYANIHKDTEIDKLVSAYLYYKKNNYPVTIIINSVKNIYEYKIENWNKLQKNIYSIRDIDKIINSIYEIDTQELNNFNFKFNYLPIDKKKPVCVNFNLYY